MPFIKVYYIEFPIIRGFPFESRYFLQPHMSPQAVCGAWGGRPAAMGHHRRPGALGRPLGLEGGARTAMGHRPLRGAKIMNSSGKLEL